jgi:hypothetical protein
LIPASSHIGSSVVGLVGSPCRSASACTAVSGSRTTKEAPLPKALALRHDGAAMQFDQVFGNRESKTEPAMYPRRGGIGLVKALEDPFQMLRGDAGAVVSNVDGQMGVEALSSYVGRDLPFWKTSPHYSGGSKQPAGGGSCLP